jgi:2-enoate reductase
MNGSYQKIIADLEAGFGTWFNEGEKWADGGMSNRLYPYDRLFSPIQVNSIKIKNRIVMGPMGNFCMCDETGRPGNKMLQYFAERAKGGTGLITSGVVPVSFNVEPSLTEPGDLTILPRIDRSRTVYAGWRMISQAIHSYGAHFFIQLSPGVGRVGSPECLMKKYKLPVSSSWNPNYYMPAIPCRPLTDGECRKIIRNAGQASADAQALLIDGVYLHGHEGYLLEQMSNTAFNRRRFGAFSNWKVFGIDLVRQIRERCGPAYPIMYRIDISLALNETYGKKMGEVASLRKFSRERSVEMTLEYMADLVKAGVDMFDIDLGCYDNWWLPHPPGPMPPGCYLPIAKMVKAYFSENGIKSNAGLTVPVVAVGKLGYPDLAEKALREDMCDMVMLARPLLADPEWPDKAYAGKVKDIRPCIGDQEACLNEMVHGGQMQCAVNPRCGSEDVLPGIPAPIGRKKKVAVVGAGPAGIVCACTAAQRGHQVDLYEKRDRVGGELIAGSVPKIKFDVANYLRYLNNLLDETAARYQLMLHLGSEASLQALKDGGYDAVVAATGGRPVRPPLDGAGLPCVVQAVDLLLDLSPAVKADKIAVIGGGSVGCEVAYLLACEMGKHVSVVEMLPYFMKDSCTANRGQMIHYLERAGVDLLNCCRLKSIAQGYVNLTWNVSDSVPDPYNTWSPVLPENIKNPLEVKIKVREKDIELDADLVVLALGLRPDDTLYNACLKERVAAEVHNIGDSFRVGGVFDATRSGYAVGNLL